MTKIIGAIVFWIVIVASFLLGAVVQSNFDIPVASQWEADADDLSPDLSKLDAIIDTVVRDETRLRPEEY